MQIPTLPERDPFILETVWATEQQFTRETQITPTFFQTPHTDSISCTHHMQHSTHVIVKYVSDAGFMRENP